MDSPRDEEALEYSESWGGLDMTISGVSPIAPPLRSGLLWVSYGKPALLETSPSRRSFLAFSNKGLYRRFAAGSVWSSGALNLYLKNLSRPPRARQERSRKGEVKLEGAGLL